MNDPDFQVVIIADDLTGANDTGVQIAKRGLTAVTIVDPTLVAEVPADGIVLDTESRTLPTEQSRAAIRVAARALGRCRNALFYKKIDSTLRGNIGAELDDLIRELEPEMVVCAPAYPKNGRTTRDGIHFLQGVPIDRTEMAVDPRNPVETASLSAVLAKDGGPRFRHVDLGVLRAGRAGALAGERFLSFDCEEQEDLQRIVRAMNAAGKRILWCGSAGLAEVLLEEFVPVRQGRDNNSGAEGLRPAAGPAGSAGGRPVLSVIGSRSSVCRRQLETAMAFNSARVIRLHRPSLIDSPGRECARLVGEMEREMAQMDHLILTSLGTETDTPAAECAGGHSQDEFSDLLAGCLAEVTAGFIRRNRIAGLFMTGGETAINIIRAVGARGLRLESELETGIPATRIIGGILHGLSAVTKAGAFGDGETLVRSTRYLAAQSRD